MLRTRQGQKGFCAVTRSFKVTNQFILSDRGPTVLEAVFAQGFQRLWLLTILMLPVNKPEIFFYYLFIQKGIYGKRCICWHTGRNHMHTHTCTLLSSKSDSVVAMPTGLNRAFSCSMMASDATLAITTPQPPQHDTHTQQHTHLHTQSQSSAFLKFFSNYLAYPIFTSFLCKECVCVRVCVCV